MPNAAKRASTRATKRAPSKEHAFGYALKQARRIRHLTLDDLATRAGCSPSVLSKIENDKTTPSFGMLFRICKALRLDVTTLLQAPRDPGSIVTKAGHHPVFSVTGMEITKLLPASPDHRMEAALVKLMPGAGSEPSLQHGAGEQLGFVMEGRIALTVDGKTHKVEAGDTFVFSYDRPHSFANASRRVARVLFVFTPPGDFGAPSSAAPTRGHARPRRQRANAVGS